MWIFGHICGCEITCADVNHMWRCDNTLEFGCEITHGTEMRSHNHMCECEITCGCDIVYCFDITYVDMRLRAEVISRV